MVRREVIRLTVALAVLVLAVLGGYSVAFAGRVPPGYFLGTRQLAGLTGPELRAVLRQTFDDRATLALTTGGQTEQRTLAQLGVTYQVDQMVDEILEPSLSAGSVIADADRLRHPVIIAASFLIDQPVYDAAVADLAAALTKPPTDASAGFDEAAGHYVLLPAHAGTTVAASDIAARLKQTLAAGETLVLVPSAGDAPALSNLPMQAAIDQANGWLKAAPAIEFGSTAVAVPVPVIRSGISFSVDEQGQTPTVSAGLDADAMRESLRTFVAAQTGSSASRIDQAALAQQIKDAVVHGTERILPRSLAAVATTAHATAVVPATSGSGDFDTVAGSDDPGGPGRRVAFRVEVEQGLGIDGNEFASAVMATLADGRSWRASGKLHFARSESGGFALYLASPHTVDRLCAPLATNGFTSCTVGGRVVINADRWQGGSPNFTGSLAEYRQYVINHEVGHEIGMHHHPCPGSGVAPVMHQQTLGMGGCTPGPWPQQFELEMVR